MTPARLHALEQVVGLVLVSAGVGMMHVPSALIVFGLGVLASTVFPRRT